ncbi:methyltransferase domain-containing protein [Hydrogenimonas thermophila]|uniref:Methyltransferase domain-containing protein n=1 Tax=Hydrogenimonas thermophila TaxID=223786 RepID=A0A1I5L2X6_9BACT|nr:methyltransferase domain-containing protein [Hydrogenimonas thermophila]WOE70030.1 methyltransferase domain-containing protein [Hydrogenimonas thermophila]WOE72547.1 methyltransferase domain-containing protein [Hydrogenimonas thermophila]SFO91689.1 Methyltransferase domain-containing protein [Hydrogenimonas thermophila]
MLECPLCKAVNLKKVYINKNMPFGIFLKNEVIDLEISFCNNCGFVFQNSAYTDEYDKKVEKLYSSYDINRQYNFPKRDFYSQKALEFIEEFIKDEIDYNVLEIGSNRGDLLYLLKEKFQKINVLGCEPTKFQDLKVLTIQNFFSADLFCVKFDLIILRHTLEHIKYPKNFLEDVKKVLKDDGKIYIEVPNLLNSLNNKIEDFTPDHVNYFYLNTLTSSVSNLRLEKFCDNPFLYTIFSKQGNLNYKKNNKEDIINQFKEFQKSIDNITMELNKYKRVIFYGVGNYYLWIYNRFKNLLEKKELYFMDDFVKKDTILNLPKIKEYNSNDLIILCSSNRKIQEKMAKNLSNVNILKPYSGIFHV